MTTSQQMEDKLAKSSKKNQSSTKNSSSLSNSQKTELVKAVNAHNAGNNPPNGDNNANNNGDNIEQAITSRFSSSSPSGKGRGPFMIGRRSPATNPPKNDAPSPPPPPPPPPATDATDAPKNDAPKNDAPPPPPAKEQYAGNEPEANHYVWAPPKMKDGRHVAHEGIPLYRQKQENALTNALSLAQIDPAPYYQKIKRGKGKDAEIYDNLVGAMEDVYDVAWNGRIARNLKGLVLKEYCQKAAAAAQDVLASKTYAKQSATAYLEPYAALMDKAAKQFALYQGEESFTDAGVDRVGGAVNQLTIHEKRGVRIGRERKFFRPEMDQLQNIHAAAGISAGTEDEPKDLHMAKREKAFYILSEFLGVHLAVPTREGERTIGAQTQKGAVLDMAAGRTANEYNYQYMGIQDYDEETEEGTVHHSGGELIYSNNDTVGDRVQGKTELGVKTSSMKHVEGNVRNGKIKGGTINALDPNFLRDLNRLNLLDILVGHPDRHLGNFLLDADNKGRYRGMTAIDNDAVFGTEATHNEGRETALGTHAGMHKYNQTGIKAGMHMDKELAERIKQVAEQPGVLYALLKNLLSREEIEALVNRFKQLSEIIKQNEEVEGAMVEDWSKRDMNELVKEELLQSAGARDNLHEGESANSYISRFMLITQARDEDERATQAAYDEYAKEAQEEAVIEMDEQTEDEALQAYYQKNNHFEKQLPQYIAPKNATPEEKQKLKEDRNKDPEYLRLQQLSAQYEKKLRREIFDNGLEAVLQRIKQKNLPAADEKRLIATATKFYKDMLDAAKKKSFHGARSGTHSAVDSNIY